MPAAARRPPWQLVIAASALLSLLLMRRYAVGLVNDDADYALAARTLATGGGFFAKLFNSELLRGRVPGLPLVLAPLMPFSGPPFALLRLVPWLSTIAACWLFWKVSEDELPPWPRFFALTLFALNPLVVDYAGRVMTECVHAACALGCFWLLKRLLRRESPREAIALGLLLGWAGILRGEGGALIAATALGFAVARRWRPLLVSAPLGLAVVAAFAVGNRLSSGTPTHYLQLWSQIMPFAGEAYWRAHQLALMRVFAWVALFGAETFPASAAASLAATALLLAWAVLFARGARRLESANRSRGLLAAMLAFMGIHLLVHLLWPSTDPRFLIPILPVALLCTAAGAQGLPRPLVAAGLSAWLLAFGVNHARALMAAPETVPEATFLWIQASTPPSARFWGFYDSSLVELYTRRPARFQAIRGDEEAFRYALETSGVEYLLFSPLRVVFEPNIDLSFIPNRLERARAWAASTPAYSLAYENEAEGTKVYALKRSEPFERAYASYLSAMGELRAGRWDAGLSLLERSLKEEPKLVSALNAYGATCLLAGRPLALAEKRLRLAVALRPDDAVARANLERVLAARATRR